MPRFAPGPYSRARRPRPSEKNALRLFSGLPPEGRLTSERPPRGGTGSARPEGRRGVDRGMCPVRQPASCAIKGWKWNASALVRPCHADAQSASLRENHPPRCPRVYSPRPLSQASPPGGGAPPAREKKLAFYWAIPLRATSFPLTPPDNEGPLHPLGRATRAHRVRPSKKIPWRTLGRTPRGPLFRARILAETSS
jgi:hypothetical protein